MSPTANRVIDRLDATRQQWWLFTLLTTTVLSLATSIALFLIFMLADAILQLPQAVLLVFLLAWFLTSVGLIVLVFRRLTRNQRSLEATAVRVETEMPELHSNLINVVQLTEDDVNVNRRFCEAAVERAASALGEVSFDTAAARTDRWRRFADRMQTPRDFAESLGVFGLRRRSIPDLPSAAPQLGLRRLQTLDPVEVRPVRRVGRDQGGEARKRRSASG